MRMGFRKARPNPASSISIKSPSLSSIPSPKLNASAPKINVGVTWPPMGRVFKMMVFQIRHCMRHVFLTGCEWL